MIKSSVFKASRRSLLVIAFGSALSLLAAGPALAEKNDGHGRGNQHASQGQRGWHGERGGRDWRDGRRYRSDYRRPYYYAQPVYAPPPVYYEPQQSPGISLFFPLDLRR